MTGRTHKQAGFAAGIGTLPVSVLDKMQTGDIEETLTIALVYIASAVVGALLADIDSETSTIGEALSPLSKLINLLRKKGVICFRHRYFFHSIWMPLILCAAGICGYFLLTKSLLVAAVIFGVTVGYLSHIFIDYIESEVHLFGTAKFKVSLFHLEGEKHKQARARLDKITHYVLKVANVLLVVGKISSNLPAIIGG